MDFVEMRKTTNTINKEGFSDDYRKRLSMGSNIARIQILYNDGTSIIGDLSYEKKHRVSDVIRDPKNPVLLIKNVDVAQGAPVQQPVFINTQNADIRFIILLEDDIK